MAKSWSTWFDAKTLARSVPYFEDGLVGEMVCTDGVLYAEVDGSDCYSVTIALKNLVLSNGNVFADDVHATCTCPVVFMCKHAAAALRVYESMQQPTPNKRLGKPEISKVGSVFPGNKKAISSIAIPDDEIAPILSYENTVINKDDESVMRLLAGDVVTADHKAKKKPSTQDLLFLLDRKHLGRVIVTLATARRLKDGSWREIKVKEDPVALLVNIPGYVSDDDRGLIGLLVAENRNRGYVRSAIELGGSTQSGALLDRMAASGRLLMASMNDWGGVREVDPTPVPIGPGLALSLEWHAEPKQLWRLRMAGDQTAIVIASMPPRVVYEGKLGPLTTELDARRLAHVASLPPVDGITAHRIATALGIAPPPVLAPEPVLCEPVAHLWRTRVEPYYGAAQKLRQTVEVVTLSFRYGEHVVRANDPSLRAGKDGPTRDVAAEQRALSFLRVRGISSLANWNNYPWRLIDRAAQERAEHSLAPAVPSTGGIFSHQVLPNEFLLGLVQAGWRVERRDGSVMKREIVDGGELIAEVGDQDKNDWFQLHLGIEVDGQRIDLAPALANLVAGGSTAFAALERAGDANAQVLMPLGDGRLVRLPTERLRRLVEFISALYSTTTEGLGISPEALLAIDDISDVLPRWLGADRLRALAERLRPLLKPGEMDPPADFAGTLRPYQRHGLAWLQRLREAGAGGVLADDMGLGKTVQVLAHLAIEHQAGRLQNPALVIAPASVASNWLREARKFYPKLRVVLRHGLERHGQAYENVDLVVTTYGTLLRDRETLEKQEWSLLICDEAQFLKNANAKAAQAVRALKANSRLSLSGTPVENHLGELWAQLHWLNPGLLGSRATFDTAFRTPIEKAGDQTRLEQLQRRIAPFLLRRTKALVAKDLPAKTSSILAVRLEGGQRDLYESVRIAMDDRLASALKDKGLRRSRIEVLDALLKLRQCCCDPRLVKAKGASSVKLSAKLDALCELLPTLIEDGRRILIFSQFTSMLALIDKSLEELEIKRVILTGETPVPQRQALIDRFQNGEVPVFLISLKAGGTGLNLTAADTVILYDPWWNPAVEDQAIDRVHRIGQDKPVFVYRIVAQGTVEERMVELQGRKRALADALYGDEERVAGDLTEADLAALLAPIED